MSQIQQILNYVKNINERLNLWSANAKKTEELPVMETMDPEGLLIVSELVDGIWTSKQLEIKKIIDGIALSGQDNKVREVLLGTITADHDLNYLLDNNGITVTENEIVVLTALTNVNSTLIQKQYLWKLGKGTYNPIGSANSNTKLIELQPRFISEITAEELTSSPSAIVYDFGVITDTVLNVINTNYPAYNYTDDEKIYYIRATKDSVNLLYNFIGINRTYGTSGNQMTDADLVLVYSSANTGITELLNNKLDKGTYTGDAGMLEADLLSKIDLKEDKTNKQNNLNFDGTGNKYATVDGINAEVAKLLGEQTFGAGEKYFEDNVNFSSLVSSGTSQGIPAVAPNEFVVKSQLDAVDNSSVAKLAEAKLYYDGLITQLVDGAPENANTLKELNDKILAIQSIIGGSNPDADTLVNTVAELLAVFSTYTEGVNLVTLLAQKVNTTDIYNALDGIIAGKTLDARQGKVLNNLITALTSVVGDKADTLYVDGLFSQLSVKYEGATPSTIAIGGIPAGTNLSGIALSSLFEQMLVVYQNPSFTSAPNVSSQNLTVEVGTTLTGAKTFTWSTNNNGNIKPNIITIFDITSNLALATLLANDSSEVVNITTMQLNSNTATQQWRMEGKNTKEVNFQSSTRIVVANYIRYFGPTTSSVTNSASVKALTLSAFQTSNANTFQLNTGASLSKFIVALPPSIVISSVIDLDALSVDITSQYVLKGTVNVTDAGGTNRLYNIYEMNVGAAYSSSHRHEIRTV
jgi:hypothetical protein